MKLENAQKLAISICEKLKPHTTKLHIAGSVRRKKPNVKDIEIICRPLYIEQDSDDLFTTKKIMVISPEFTTIVESLGQIQKGNTHGRYVKIFLHEKEQLDLFIPVEEDFYRQYAVRTGPAEYSHKVIASGWLKKGWVGSDLGLRQKKDCVPHEQPGGKVSWECVRNKNSRPPVWDSEESFFQWLEVPYLKPELRIV